MSSQAVGFGVPFAYPCQRGIGHDDPPEPAADWGAVVAGAAAVVGACDAGAWIAAFAGAPRVAVGACLDFFFAGAAGDGARSSST